MLDVDARLWKRAEAGAEWIRSHASDCITVVCHVDADGVSGGALASKALQRATIEHRVQPVRSLDDASVQAILHEEPDALWFTDLGSAAYMRFPTSKLVCDHHQLERNGSQESFPHVNPLLDDLPGNTISGAGAAFLVAVALDGANMDLLPIALVGAAGDLQDRDTGAFTGANQVLVEHGTKEGLLECSVDLSWFGLETRPLSKYFSLARDPAIPTFTGDRRAVEAALSKIGVPSPQETKWWQLDDGGKRRVRSEVIDRMLDCGAPVDGVFRCVIRLVGEESGSPTRELQEFATLLNSTARYGEAEVGLAVARGDRGDAYQEALDLLQNHRRHLVRSLDRLSARGVQEMRALQWVHMQDAVRDTVVGIVCGMALDSLPLDRDKVLVGFAYTDDGATKVSGRSPHELGPRGVDLAAAMREAAATLGGVGGGHKRAAGATIPRGREEAFLERLDAQVAVQIGLGAPDDADADDERRPPAPDKHKSGSRQTAAGPGAAASAPGAVARDAQTDALPPDAEATRPEPVAETKRPDPVRSGSKQTRLDI